MLGAWSFDPVFGTGLIVLAAGYLWAVRSLQRRRPAIPWPRRYTVSFLSALAITWIVVLGPFGVYDDTFLWAHMVQHIALMMLVAPLMLLGAPVLLALRVSSRRVRHRRMMPILRSRTVGWLTDPVVGWVIFAGVLLGTHFSPFYDFALNHPLVHDYVEHPLYLGAGLVYYYPLLSVNPGPRRVQHSARALSLFSLIVPETLTAFVISSSHHVLYPFYAHAARPFGPGAIADQRWGATLMLAASLVMVAVCVAIAGRDRLSNGRHVGEQAVGRGRSAQHLQQSVG